MEGVSIGLSVNYTGLLLNLIKRNVPQSSVTEPNKGNVVTVTVFGKEETNTIAVRGEATVLPFILPTPRHLSARKTASVTGKNL